MKEKKKSKGGLLLVLPILALPFLTFAFWALGGGRTSGVAAEKASGINAELPDAHPEDDSALDKMAFYDQAEKEAKKDGTDNLDDTGDSLNSRLGQNPLGNDSQTSFGDNSLEVGGYGNSQRGAATSESRIRQRMEELQRQLESSTGNDYPGQEFNRTSRLPPTGMNGNGSPPLSANDALATDTSDPEMEQLQGMMNKIYDIQHPDEVATRLRAVSEKDRGILYPVTTTRPENVIHFLSDKTIIQMDSGSSMTAAAFHGLKGGSYNEPVADKGIRAVTQQDQILVNGASIKLRLQQDVYANGILVSQGTLITGQVQLSNDRLQVEVMSLLSGQHLIQVKLIAYDTDGMEGLNIPGSINREVVRQSGDNTLQSIGVGTLNPSIGAQAAAAGIETAKTLFSRKLKLTKVFVKAGHQLLLKNQ